MTDPGDLSRFVTAQDEAGTYDRALAELYTGTKRGHWMWFVFPQLAGLGRSPVAQHFALSGLAQARAYLTHPVLGPRLLAACRALTGLPGQDPVAVLGEIDAMKLRSSMTLFTQADAHEPVYGEVLEQYFDGQPDELTLRLLGTPRQGA